MKDLLATKLKVASAIFLASFIVWLVLILLVAQPTDNIGRLQFSNFLILSLFLSSAIAASFSSMIIGLDLIEFKMRPMSLTKFRRGRLSIRTRKSRIASQKSKPRDLSLQLEKMPKDLSLQLEKMHISETKLEAEMPYLKEETVLPELTLSNEVVIEKPQESEKITEEDAIQMRANVHSQPPEIETIQEPSYEREPLPTSAKRNSEVDSEKNKCRLKLVLVSRVASFM